MANISVPLVSSPPSIIQVIPTTGTLCCLLNSNIRYFTGRIGLDASRSDALAPNDRRLSMAMHAKAQSQITSPKKLPSLKLINALATEKRTMHIIKAILFSSSPEGHPGLSILIIFLQVSRPDIVIEARTAF